MEIRGWFPNSHLHSGVVYHKFTITLTTRVKYIRHKTRHILSTYQSVRAVHRKNCEPFVFGPELAIDSMPPLVCFNVKFSSSNFFPYIDLPPVPLWFVKSPPWHIWSLVKDQQWRSQTQHFITRIFHAYTHMCNVSASHTNVDTIKNVDTSSHGINEAPSCAVW